MNLLINVNLYFIIVYRQDLSLTLNGVFDIILLAVKVVIFNESDENLALFEICYSLPKSKIEAFSRFHMDIAKTKPRSY